MHATAVLLLCCVDFSAFYWRMEEIGVLVPSEPVSFTSVSLFGLASSRLESFIYIDVGLTALCTVKCEV